MNNMLGGYIMMLVCIPEMKMPLS